MAPPLSTAAVVNALIFSSYGESSRLWDVVFHKNNDNDTNDDKKNSTKMQSSWIKSFVCGSFAGGVQALVICPSEHIKCRLQIQHGVGCKDHIFKGPFDAMDKILKNHGFSGLYRGFICTAWREIPAFGLYFATYDFVKEQVSNIISTNEIEDANDSIEQNSSSREWAISALAGGCSGALTWAAIYPFDVIKTRIQTSPLNTPIEKRRILYLFQKINKEHGPKFFFRGLGVTLLRAFPVNAIIFPVYEFTLLELSQRGIGILKSSHNGYIEESTVHTTNNNG